RGREVEPADDHRVRLRQVRTGRANGKLEIPGGATRQLAVPDLRERKGHALGVEVRDRDSVRSGTGVGRRLVGVIDRGQRAAPRVVLVVAAVAPMRFGEGRAVVDRRQDLDDTAGTAAATL